MKGIKKLLTGILAATMVFSMSLSAGATDATAATTAATTASITIESNNTSNKEPDATITYTYYEIFKADILSLSGDGIVSYYVTNEKLADLIGKTGLFKATKSASGDRWNIELTKSTAEGDEIAKALNTDDIKKAALSTGSFTSAKGVATKDNLDPGYYLILSSLGSVAAVQTVGEVHINEKNTYPTVEKEDNEDYAQMFDTVVTYTITVNVPSSVVEKDIKVVDTATDGLTFDSVITAKVGETKIADYGWESKVENDNNTITYTTTIPAETVVKYAGESIVLTYTATVNEKAVVLDPENNTVHIEYDNYKSAETQPVEVVTLGLKIKKVDGTDTTKTLTGAQFTLWDAAEGGNNIAVVKVSDGVYRVAKQGEQGVNIAVDENGIAQVNGLDAKNYYLQEEVAPTGYNKLDKRSECAVNGETQINASQVQEFTVENNSGSTLPSTGGVGTTIFYICGGILIIAGVAYFMLRRKAQAE